MKGGFSFHRPQSRSDVALWWWGSCTKIPLGLQCNDAGLSLGLKLLAGDWKGICGIVVYTTTTGDYVSVSVHHHQGRIKREGSVMCDRRVHIEDAVKPEQEQG